MFKKIRSAACALLSLLLLASLSPAAAAKSGKKVVIEPTEIHISSAAELAELSVNCSLDTWSDNVRVVLDNDISLAGSDFSPIPIFNGVFDGAGHAIYDLNLSAAQSPCGLFLETGEKADIRDLTVNGTVSPDENDDMVGGIVGRNRGALTECAFNGRVTGKSQVGGIVGRNEPSGLLTGCISTGSVQGISRTGGVVGYNLGTLLACENKSYVNTEVVDPSLRLDQIDTSSLVNLYRSVTTDAADITTDIGGVAGGSEGFIEHCRNTGTVGYLHIGYNVGGIAGRSSGSVNASTNAAEVYGRKNVGGVVGRAEPLVEVSQAQNLIAGLSHRLSALNSSIDKAIQDAGEDVSGLAGRLSGLSGYLKPIHSAIAALNIENPETFSGLQSAIASSVSSMSGQLSSISKDVDANNKDLMRDMKSISDNLSALSGTAMQTVYALSGAQKNEDILSDDSVSMADGLILGKISDSVNEGEIRGDSNTGGIAGALTIEQETSLDEITGGSDNNLIQNRYSFRAAITGCINRGIVTAKRECAGGICGRLDLGLVTNCAAYGSISLEDGDYAGGVCGLSYAAVQNCCAKCTLAGTRYVGGVLGNGYDAANSEEHPSSVSGCYTLVDIPDKPQFSGAISGGGAGEYENNFFVPAGYAGMDKLSIHGLAEPMDFEAFAQVKGLPEECRSFTLTFVVDGEPVKTLPFAYGDSFERDVFPKVEKRDGAYPVWDRTDLHDLRFDTVVTAEYRTDKTVLGSDLQREDGRSAVFAEGQFQEGDALKVQSLPIRETDAEAFAVPWREALRAQLRSLFSHGSADYSICTGVEEKLHVAFPDDGQTEHTLRLLPTSGSVKDHRLYRWTQNGWERLPTESFGSYLTFTVPGTEATLCMVSTIESWWIGALAAGAVLALLLLVVLLVKLHKKHKARAKAPKDPKRLRKWVKAHKKTAMILALCLVAAAVAAGVILGSGRVGTSIAVTHLLRAFAAEETDIRTDVVITTGTQTTPISTTVHRLNSGGRMISCVDRFGMPIYIADGKVYLENGRAFRVSGSHLDQSSLMLLVRDTFSRGEIGKTNTPEGIVYSAQLRDKSAARLLEMFLGSDYPDSVQAEEISARLTVSGGKVTALSFAGSGVTEGGTAFTLTAELTPEPMTERPTIPRAVLAAMADESEVTELLTEDLLSLFSAWMKYDDAKSVDALLTMRAEGGALHLRTDCDYFRERLGEREIHCVGSPLFTVYFTDKAACDPAGQTLLREENDLVDAARLIGAARELFQKGRCTCEHLGESRVFTITLAEKEAGELAETLLPALKGAGIRYGETAVSITVEKGELSSIRFRSEGTVRIVTREVDTTAEVSVRFIEGRTHTIPMAVRGALLG